MKHAYRKNGGELQIAEQLKYKYDFRHQNGREYLTFAFYLLEKYSCEFTCRDNHTFFSFN